MSDLVVSERSHFTEFHEVINEDESCEIQDSDLYDFLENVRTDEIAEKWVKQQNQIELMIEQPVDYISILGGRSEPLGSIPRLDYNWLSCANQAVMLEDSDEYIPALEDLSEDYIEVDNQHIVVNSPNGLNLSPIEAIALLEDIYAGHGVGPIDSNESTTAVLNDSENDSMVEIHQTQAEGPLSGRSRVVSVGFR